MRIQHNIPALNSHRNLGINNSFTSKNLEKLSSGYRINRAGDDAAGLAISEKMRGQIRGLAMAEQNTSMGINLIQTAEGGLNETHAILQRMRELAVQSSNGTFQNSDRQQITHEFEDLMSEIDRISESTHYNGIKLLDGSLGGSAAQPVSAIIGGTVTVGGVENATEGEFLTDAITIAAGDSFTIEYKVGSSVKSVTVAPAGTTDADLLAALQATELGDLFTITTPAAGEFNFKANETGTGGPQVFTVVQTTAGGVAAGVSVTKTPGQDKGLSVAVNNMEELTIGAKKFQFIQNASELKEGYEAIFVGQPGGAITGDEDAIVQQLKAKGYNAETDGTKLIIRGEVNSGGLVFQIGANGGDDQRVSLSVNDMSSKSIGIEGGEMLSTASVATISDANKAIDIIDAATDMVSAQRAKLGALQNRLEHTMNNLGVTKENLTASESTIRDVDMAKEMMDFTKNNILMQASQAMLAQANQLPQGVLQLLR